MIDFTNYKYWLVYAKNNRAMNICEVYAENEAAAIAECLDTYNYDGTYNASDLFAVCRSSEKNLFDKMHFC